jgi:excisionase family DNA binding protein
MKGPHQRYFESPILTVKECAAFLGVHPTTIYRLLKHGLIPGFKLGSDWRFSKKELTDWIDNQPRGKLERRALRSVPAKRPRKT